MSMGSLRRAGVSAVCVGLGAVMVMGNTKCAGVGNGSGTGISSSGGGAVVVAVPTGRSGGVWVGQRGGYSWLAAGAAAGAAAGLIAAATNNEGRTVPAGGEGSGSYGATGHVPFASAEKCREPGKGPEVLEKWVWGAGPGMGLRNIFLDCDGLRNARKTSGLLGKAKNIMECITWIFARGEETLLGGAQTAWKWGRASVVVDGAGRIVSVRTGGMSWARCAAGGGPGGGGAVAG